MPKRVGPKGLILQQRDLWLLRDLYESRAMTLSHAAALHFGGRLEAAKKRVQKLKAVGILVERPRRVNEPSVIHIGPVGLDQLNSDGILQEYPYFSKAHRAKRAHVSDRTLAHELQVMDVKAYLSQAIRRASGTILETFVTWPRLLEFKALDSSGKRVKVRPDGYLQLSMRESDGTEYRYRFFLEVDRSHEVQQVLLNKMSCYRDYYRSGEYALRCGGNRDRPEEFPFRVLFVFKSADRRNVAIERMLQLPDPIGRRACMTTLAELKRDALGKIWITPRDYDLATQNTRFAIRYSIRDSVHRRDIERDRFVEAQVPRCALLDDN